MYKRQNPYRGNYDTFKALEATKREQQQKAWEKQERSIKQAKASGKSKAKALEAESKGAVKAGSTPAAVVRQCSFTYIMLSTPEAVRSVYTMPEGVLAGVSNSKAIIDCATLAVEDMEYLASEVIMRGGRFVEAPVSGSKKPAADGQLIFLAAGD